MKNLLITSLFLVSANAVAFDVSDNPTFFIDLHVTSFHSQENWYKVTKADHGMTTEELPFNENNGGVGLRYQVKEFLDVSAGFFKNSFDNNSVYLGGEVHTSRENFVSVGLAAALVSGYGADTPTPTPIIALLVAQFGLPQIGVRIGYMPFGPANFGTLSLYAGF